MDPLTQGLLGASAPQSAFSRKQAVNAGVLGFLGGMAPDLDVLIRSESDPLLFLEYHRHFTHSLVFIPIGGLIVAAVLHLLFGRRRQLSFRQTYIFCTLGYATHALLDACTTYGTQLFWPFSDVRIAWNTVSVVDPLVTLPLLVLIGMALWRRRPMFARIGLAWVLVYLCLGLVQRDRAQDAGWELAASRGHTPVRLEAKPSFGNIILWKVVYETGEDFHVDAVRAGSAIKIFEGDVVRKLDVDRDMPWLDRHSQQARDVERFRWFSNDYLALDPDDVNRVIDVRYSHLPNEIKALWSIQLRPGAAADEHARYLTHRDPSEDAVDRLLGMLFD